MWGFMHFLLSVSSAYVYTTVRRSEFREQVGPKSLISVLLMSIWTFQISQCTC